MAKNVATVEDFEALKNDVGLVPMRFLRSTISEKKDSVWGAEPYTALRWYNEGLAEPVGKLSAKPAEPRQAALDPEDIRKDAIDLGTDPLNAHRLTKIAAAKKIKGSDESMTEDEATKVIQAELDRRNGSVDLGPNAVTSQKTVTA